MTIKNREKALLYRAKKPKKKKGVFVTFVTTKVKGPRGHSGIKLALPRPRAGIRWVKSAEA